MWSPNKGEKVEKEEQVVVAIDKDKSSQYALKWAVEHVVGKSKNVTLLHVKQKPSSIPSIKRGQLSSSLCCTNSSLSAFGNYAAGNHVSISDANEDVARTVRQQLDIHAKELLLPFRCFCNRKDIKCQEVIAEDTNISKAIIDYVATNMCEIVVVGASSRNGLLRRLKGSDVPTAVSKNAPDFCTVYVISKRKIISVRSATRPVPVKGSSNAAQRGSPRTYDPAANPTAVPLPSNSGDHGYPIYNNSPRGGGDRSIAASPSRRDMEIRSPFTRGRAANGRLYGELPLPSETDISYVGNSPSRLPINNRADQYLAHSADRTFQDTINYIDGGIDNPHIRRIPRLSTGSNHELDRSSFGSDRRSIDLNSFNDQYSPSASSICSGFSTSSLVVDDVESEMRRLRQELKQTMDMYNAACKDAIMAKQKAKELQVLKVEERQRLEDARSAEEAALALADKEKAKCKAALEAAEAAQMIAELEAQKRMSAEMKAIKEAEEKKKALQALTTQNNADVRYRKYTIEEIEIATDCFSESLIIGEGGYGPVYKCTLDHTPVAIKVLRPDAAQGQTQFQQEVEILSCIRHPNMVLLLGACPEYGCLVYEFMSNGSLEDRLFCKGNTPILPWQVRFRIAAEIGTGLLFLHQTKPEPLVHRDLKPANILLDRNFTSKICDVGLARLVPPSVADGVTRYRMTQTAGTFCYIDPEYQQTGMLGIKSDIYSLGIILLQLVTGKLPIGLTHYVERAIEKGNLVELLDPRVKDWPIEETVKFVKLALRCAELRRKDRPDLRKVVLPELNKFREFAEGNMVADGSLGFGNLVAATTKLVPHHPGPTLQEVISDPQMVRSGSDTPKSRSSSSFLTSAV